MSFLHKPPTSAYITSSFSRSSSSRSSFSSYRLDSLYGVTYLPNDDKIPVMEFPLVNPYNIFIKPTLSLARSIKQIFVPKSKLPFKEFVQASRFDKFQIIVRSHERFVTLALRDDLAHLVVSQGYTHLHSGVIRLVLTFHSRKGIPAFCRIALLDTWFTGYQQAYIGTIQTTLNAGIVFITLFPNFNMPLKDTNLNTMLKVQIHITGAPQVSTTYVTTLHHQVYII